MSIVSSRSEKILCFFCARKWLYAFRKISSNGTAIGPVLGIETSCDDTAVSIVSDRILSSNRFSDHAVHSRLGGICPSVVAQQHRDLLPIFVEDCLFRSNLRLSDLGGVAVSTRPGLVIALRAGIMQAIALARKGRIPLIDVHHMQAHATMATFCNRNIRFPFVAFLVSGAHSLITVAHSPTDFELFGKNLSGSCGECIDKIVRTLLVLTDTYREGHYGAILEKLASRCGTDGRLKYRILMPPSCGANFNFTWIKDHYISLLKRIYNQSDFEIAAFCASVEHCIAGYLASRLCNCLDYLLESGKIDSLNKKLVFCGGVAANNYVRKMLQLVCTEYNLDVYAPPPLLCTDNGEMVAWNGLLILQSGLRHSRVCSPDALPVFLAAEARSTIGNDCTSLIPSTARRKLSVKHLAENRVVFYKKIPASQAV